MKVFRLFLMLVLSLIGCTAFCQSSSRQEAEYYVAAYTRYYQISVDFVRAVVEQESGWHRCAVSAKGAAGLMQLMPATAARLKVRDRCNIQQNVSGGVRYLAWLKAKFHGDLRLVAAAYYAGEHAIEGRELKYSKPDVVAYVASIRARVEFEKRFRSAKIQRTPGRK